MLSLSVSAITCSQLTPSAGAAHTLGIYTSFPKARSTEVAVVVVVYVMTEDIVGTLLWLHSLHPFLSPH